VLSKFNELQGKRGDKAVHRLEGLLKHIGYFCISVHVMMLFLEGNWEDENCNVAIFKEFTAVLIKCKSLLNQSAWDQIAERMAIFFTNRESHFQ